MVCYRAIQATMILNAMILTAWVVPRLPKKKRRARPPKVTGYTWRKDGAGEILFRFLH